MKGMKCCCVSCCIAVLLVIVLVCVALFVLTPEMIGIAETPLFEGKSLKDLGLSDLTLFNVIQEIINLMSPPNEEEFTTHTQEDLNQAQTKLSLPTNESGTVDYSNVLENGLNNTDQDVQLSDSETAAVLNDIIKNAGNLFRNPSNSNPSGTPSGTPSGSDPSGSNPSNPESGSDPEQGNSSSPDAMLGAIGENVSLSGLEIDKNEEGESTISITVGVEVKELLEEMGGELPAELTNLIHDGKTFITQEYVVQNTADGIKLKEEQDFSDMLINGKESSVIMGLLSGMTGGEGDEDMITGLQNQMGEAIMGMFAQLGANEIIHTEDGQGYFNFKPSI